MTKPVDDIAAGRAAWERIKGHDRKSWGDCVQVARALAVGRAEMMKAANTNQPVGTTYNRLMVQWLNQNGFEGINTQERYRALRCLDNLDAIEAWRAKLTSRPGGAGMKGAAPTETAFNSLDSL